MNFFAMKQLFVALVISYCWAIISPAIDAQSEGGACRVIVLLPFTSSYEIPEGIPVENENQYNFFSRQSASRLSFSYAAAALFAMNHFNSRDASIVPEIASIDPSCSIYFTEPTFVDSQVESGAALRGLYEAADATDIHPCAVLGTVEKESNTHIIPAINSYKIPLLSYYTEDAPFLVSEGTVGLTLSAAGRAAAMVKFLKSREYLAFCYSVESERESDLAEALVKLGGDELSVTIIRIHTSDNIKQRMQQLKDTGIKSIYLSVLKPSDLVTYAVLLDELDMLELAYVYILPPEIIPTDLVGDLYGEHELGAPLYKLLSGAIVFDRLDGFRIDPDNDKFLELWMQQGNETVSKLNSIVPKSAYYLAAPDYFQSVKPSNFASFVYDAVMSIGFGACIAEKETEMLAAELEANGIDPQVEQRKVDVPLQEVEGFDVAPRDETSDELESNEGTTQPFHSQPTMSPPTIQKNWIGRFTPSRNPSAEKTLTPTSVSVHTTTTMNFIPTTTRTEGSPTPNPLNLPPTQRAVSAPINNLLPSRMGVLPSIPSNSNQTQSPVQLPVPTESSLIPYPFTVSPTQQPEPMNLTIYPVNVNALLPVQEVSPTIPSSSSPASTSNSALPTSKRPLLNLLAKSPRSFAISLPPIIPPKLPPIILPIKLPLINGSRRPSIIPGRPQLTFPAKRPRSFSISLPPIIPPRLPPNILPNKSPLTSGSRRPSIIPGRPPLTIPAKRPRSFAISLPPIIPPRLPPIILPIKSPLINGSRRPSIIPGRPPLTFPAKRPRSFAISLPPIIPPRLPPIILPIKSPLINGSRPPSIIPERPPLAFPIERPRVVITLPPIISPRRPPTVLPIKFPSIDGSRQPNIPQGHPPLNFPFNSPSFPILPTQPPRRSPVLLPIKSPSIEPQFIMPSKRPHAVFPAKRPSVDIPPVQPPERPSLNFPVVSPSASSLLPPIAPPGRPPFQLPIEIPSIILKSTTRISSMNAPTEPMLSPTWTTPSQSPIMGRRVVRNLESRPLVGRRVTTKGVKLNREVSAKNAPTLPKTKRETTRNLLSTQNNGNSTRGTLLAGILETKFHGASGIIDFGSEIGKERNAETIAIGIYNIRPGNVTIMGKQSFYAALVFSNNDSEWVQLKNQAITYRDGSIQQPKTKRVFVEENYLSPEVRAFGLVLMGIAWALGFAALIGLHIHKKDTVVQRAQPFFLKMLCYGSIITSSSIFTLSWDEGAGWSDRQLDIACAMTPWFFFVGIILTFCALFTKLWRVDKVLQFRRRAVTVSNVMKPCIAIMSICFIILILWTVLDPWTWERNVIKEIPPESYGKCTSRNFWVWFGPLIGLLFFAEGLTMYFAWKTADIPDDFRDSGAVMYASFAQMQSWAFGIPMLSVLGSSSSEASYFGRICLIWIFSVSSVVVVVGPKLISAFRMRRNPIAAQKKDRVRVTGLESALSTEMTINNSIYFGLKGSSEFRNSRESEIPGMNR